MAGLYVYAIVDGELNATTEISRGIENESVFSVGNSDISAVVSQSKIKRLPTTEELLLTHERVVESLMFSHTVLPMRYGTVVLDRAEILEIIEERRETIEALLEKVKGKVELGVKVLWNPEPIKKRVERDDGEVEQLRVNIQKSQHKGRRYLMEKLYDGLIQRKAKSYGEKFISHILEKLSPFSVDEVCVKFPTERLLLSASFLVRKDNVTDFEMLVQQLITKYQQLSFLFTGPWPPYNFTKIQLAKETEFLGETRFLST